MCKMEHFADNFDVDRLGRRRKTCRDCKVRRERSGFMTRVRTQLAENGLTPETLNEYKYAGGDGANGGNLRHLHYYELARPGEDFPEHVDHCEICDHFIVENCYLEHKERGAIELVVGNCCIKRFVEDSGRTCRNCGAEHRSAPTTSAKSVSTRTASQPRRVIRAAPDTVTASSTGARGAANTSATSAAASRRLTAPPAIAVTTVRAPSPSLQPFRLRWSSEPRPRIFGPIDTYGVGRKLN